MKTPTAIALAPSVAAFCMVVIGVPGAALASTVVDLGNFGGGQSFAAFINNEGDVTGTSYLAVNNYHAFFYSGITTAVYTQGTIYDIGTFGGNFSSVKGLNASGEVSGTAYTLGSSPNAFIYHNGVLSDLGFLGGTSSFGYSLNDAGRVVGSGYLSGNTGTHAMLSASPYNQTNQDLGTLGGSFGDADYINNAGQLAGNSNTTGDLHTMAFYSQDGTSLTTLSLGGNSSTATGINSNGEVIGRSSLAAGSNQHGFLYTPGTVPVIADLGTLIALNAGKSDAQALNDAGEVVGQSDVDTNGNGVPSGHHHAYWYHSVNSAWVMTDLGTLNNGLGDSTADAINSVGQIVGTTSTAAGIVPFVYINGQMIDLNTLLPANSGFTKLLTATDINDSGVIVGQGITVNGASDAYILNMSAIAAVPEPSTLSLIFGGLLLCAASSRRRRPDVTGPA